MTNTQICKKRILHFPNWPKSIPGVKCNHGTACL